MSLQIYLFLKFYMIEVIPYVVFVSVFCHLACFFKVHQRCTESVLRFFLLLNKIQVWIYHIYPFTHRKNTWVDSTCGLLWGNATVNIYAQVFYVYTFSFSWYILPLELLGYVVTLFNLFLGIAKLFSKLTASFLHFHWQLFEGSVLSNLHQFWVIFCLFVCIRGSMCDSISLRFWFLFLLMTNEVKYLFVCFLASCLSVLEKFLFKSLCMFLNWLTFSYWVLMFTLMYLQLKTFFPRFSFLYISFLLLRDHFIFPEVSRQVKKVL